MPEVEFKPTLTFSLSEILFRDSSLDRSSNVGQTTSQMVYDDDSILVPGIW